MLFNSIKKYLLTKILKFIYAGRKPLHISPSLFEVKKFLRLHFQQKIRNLSLILLKASTKLINLFISSTITQKPT